MPLHSRLTASVKTSFVTGVLGDWSHPYPDHGLQNRSQHHPRAGQNYQNGHLHKGASRCTGALTAVPRWRKRKLSCTTKTSPSIDVAFPRQIDQDAVKAKFGLPGVSGPVSLVITDTTTPWTLPANRAISTAPDFDYALVRVTAGR